MSVDLHLLSLPGDGDDINFILEACRPYLDGRGQPSGGRRFFAPWKGVRVLLRMT